VRRLVYGNCFAYIFHSQKWTNEDVIMLPDSLYLWHPVVCQ